MFTRTALPVVLLGLAGLLAPAAVSGRPPQDSPGVPHGRFVCTLTGAEASPPNGSLATGGGDILLRGDQIRVQFSWRGLSGPVTGFHIHSVTETGDTGPIQFDVIPGRMPEGTRGPVDAWFPIDPIQLELLRDGRMYADVHTRIYPGGEIRGALVRAPED